MRSRYELNGKNKGQVMNVCYIFILQKETHMVFLHTLFSHQLWSIICALFNSIPLHLNDGVPFRCLGNVRTCRISHVLDRVRLAEGRFRPCGGHGGSHAWYQILIGLRVPAALLLSNVVSQDIFHT